MTDLTSDEKLCPFCAETIKAAAIRCRWCGSDLPETDDTETADTETADPEPDGQPDPEPAAEPAGAEPAEAEPDSGEPAGGPGTGGWILTGALVFLVVLAGTVLVRQLMAQGDWSSGPEGNTPLAAGAVVQSDEAKRAAMMAATSATEQVLSYDAASYDEDVEASQAILAGQMEKQYSSTMDAIRDKTAENRAVVEASVVAVSTISATEHDAKLLMFVNQQTQGKHLDQPRVDLNRVIVTIHRDGSDWKITQLDAL